MSDSGGSKVTPNNHDGSSKKIKTVNVEKLNHPELELYHPLPVTIEEDVNNFIANYSEIDSFGCGSTEAEAISDLLNELTETYLDLEQHAKTLSSQSKKWWDHLQKIIIRK